MTNLDQIHELLSKWQRRAALVTAIGGVLCAIGWFTNRQQFMHSYLLAFLFWWAVTIGCMAVLMLYYLVGGRWGSAVRPLLECGSRSVPLIAILFLPVALDIEQIYVWARPSVTNNTDVAAKPSVLPPSTAVIDLQFVVHGKTPSPKIQDEGKHSDNKAAYLNKNFFYYRAAGYIFVWSVLAWFLRDRPTVVGLRRPRRRRFVSAGGLVLLALTVTFASIDWAMSLDPHWYSSIYGALVAMGGVLAGFALVTFVMASLEMAVRPTGSVIASQPLGDLGTLMLAFLMLWAYFAFSQFLIIWSGNLPEENIWFVTRLRGGWQYVGLAVVVFEFVIPFVLLLSSELKQNPCGLARTAALIFGMQFVYFLWTISPSFHPQGLFIHWADLIAPLAMGGLWSTVFLWLLRPRARWIGV